jgi:hypothetical protein
MLIRFAATLHHTLGRPGQPSLQAFVLICYCFSLSLFFEFSFTTFKNA